MIYKKRNSKLWVIGLAVSLMLFIILSFFIKTNYTLNTFAEVFPKEKWFLTKGNGGEIIRNFIDYSKGRTTSYKLHQFERGEYIDADFEKYLINKKEISVGDTIVKLYSSNVSEQFITAKEELNVAYALIESKISGEKVELVQEAQAKLNLINEKITEQNVLYERTKKLFEKQLSSQQEYDLSKWTLDLLEIEKKIYQSQLDNLKTGVKPKEVELLKAQITSYKNKLDFFNSRINQMTIVSPINGKIDLTFSSDTLLTVSNAKEVIIHCPIKLWDSYELKDGQLLSINILSLDKKFDAEVISIDNQVKIINNQQAVFVSMLIKNADEILIPGMVLDGELILKKDTLFNLLKKLLNS